MIVNLRLENQMDGEFDCFKNILMFLDGSSSSERALDYGAVIAEKYNANFIILSFFSMKRTNISSPLKARVKEMNPSLSLELMRLKEVELIEMYHQAAINYLRKKGIKADGIMLENPKQNRFLKEVLDVINKKNIDLIIVLPFGKNCIKNSFLACLAKQLFESVKIPILVVNT